MIITSQKKISEILDSIKNRNNVFLIGCTLCATVCKTGGETEIKNLAELLKKAGKQVTGWAVLDPACNLLQVKKLKRAKTKEIESSDVILSLACGGGTQAIAEVLQDKKVCPVNDTLFQGEVTELTLKKARFEEKCSLCGECLLDETAGICPVSLCPKGLMNGPCGGVKNKKCEVSDELDCVWMLIYERLKKQNELEKIKKVRGPKNYSRIKKPQKHELR
ncbi:MAG: methylenetetrahydrofolate reductase C-terminal domain-containing protein [Candidatus Omnitrophota bacterium]